MVYVMIVGIILVLCRVFGITHIAFQAAAHLFVGGLFGAWLMDKQNKWLLYLFIAMTVIETICFFAGSIKLGH